jgi:hypothetical protein
MPRSLSPAPLQVFWRFFGLEWCPFSRRPFPILSTLQANRDAVVIEFSIVPAKGTLFHGVCDLAYHVRSTRAPLFHFLHHDFVVGTAPRIPGRCYDSSMAFYLEESSMIGNSSAALIDHAPHADTEQLAAASRCQRRIGRRAVARKPASPAQPKDAIPPGICPRCGCIADHATPADCIDHLRDLIADLTPGPIGE